MNMNIDLQDVLAKFRAYILSFYVLVFS